MSNQYPRLPWRPSPDPGYKRCFIAEPHGPGMGLARVYKAPHPKGFEWVWVVTWPERFSDSGSVAEKQMAADTATIAYWDAMTSTEGWQPAPVVKPVPGDFLEWLFFERVRAWVTTQATKDQIHAQQARYRQAATAGPSIIAKDMDRLMWDMMTLAWSRFDFEPRHRLI